MGSKTSRHGTCPTCGQPTKPDGHPAFDPRALTVAIEQGRPICQHGEDLSRTTSQGLPACALCRHSLATPPPPASRPVVGAQDTLDYHTLRLVED
ncbi:hypothetical protein ACFSYH_05930 [Populibacterium corticicola]|uniref:Uncharacterized protein n=1 Tax=Populibacterium corticicola TaxID=1812826 RepID=A0ABW5XE41_9MICO